jgi:hypothetical protein
LPVLLDQLHAEMLGVFFGFLQETVGNVMMVYVDGANFHFYSSFAMIIISIGPPSPFPLPEGEGRAGDENIKSEIRTR